MTRLLHDTLETLSGSLNYQAWIYHQLRAHLGLKILDIGSGLGDLAGYFGTDGGRAIMISDADHELVARLRHRYAGRPNYRVVRLCIVEGPGPGLSSLGSFDAITCVNVLEHIRCDRKALMNMHRLLAHDGKLLLVVPALRCLFGAVDRAVGHYRRYTAHQLTRKLRQAGFVIEQQRHMNFFGLFTWWLGSRLLKQRMFRASICQGLDRFVPWFERLERMWTPPVGQSLVTICRKA